MASLDSVGVGLVGAGFIAATRARCYAQVHGTPARVVATCSRSGDTAAAFAAEHDVPKVVDDFGALLALPEVDVVDLCVPNELHRPFAERAAAAGKHVVCTKPLTAYVGQDLGDDPADGAIAGQAPQTMLDLAVADAVGMVEACDAAGVQLMYGENWVYAPSIVRALQLVETSGGTILDMRGGECHNGSHSPYSKLWRHTGGGALLRLGAHPIGAMIHAKRVEGLARNGEPIVPTSVLADVADVSRIGSFANDGTTHVTKGWVDVENWGTAILTFSDGARGVAWGGDTMLGGMESRLELCLSNARVVCNLSPNDMLRAYAPDGSVFADEYLMEKSSTGAGWSTPMPNEDWTSGQLAMCQDFVDAVANGRPARSDGALGRDVVRVVYAAYQSAREGRRVDLAGS